MRIAVLGRGLPTAVRRACNDAGIRIVPAARAMLRLYVGTAPPTRAPKPPWRWLSPRAIEPAEAAAAVLAGAYDVATLGLDLPLLVQRRVAELTMRVEPAVRPEGFVGKSSAARRVLGDL